MFHNPRYLTRGVQAEIPLALQLALWSCVDELPEPRDYFQVFRLEALPDVQIITHTSEQPDYHQEHRILTDHPVTQKVYIIDDGDHTTMLLAEEY